MSHILHSEHICGWGFGFCVDVGISSNNREFTKWMYSQKNRCAMWYGCTWNSIFRILFRYMFVEIKTKQYRLVQPQ